jgi:DUF2075 family protein
MSKKFKSHAERIAQVKVFVKGAKGLGTDMKPVDLKIKDLEKELDVYIDTDASQESLKAELNKMTKELNKSAEKIDALYRRVVDYAYSVYGKQGTELKKLGLMPWSSSRKVSKPKV